MFLIYRLKYECMCTVVFIPGKECNYFASLRDEDPQRPKAKAPAIIGSKNVKYLAPIDSLAGGTWIGANELGAVIILLNGGFQNHERKSPYAKSRGVIVTELLQSAVPVMDWSRMNMDGIEPFTLILWADNMLFQLVWDGEKKHPIPVDPSKPHIWSSATLYDTPAKAKREALFQNWMLQRPRVSSAILLHFFKQFRDLDNGFLVNRNEHLQTLSYTYMETPIAGKAVVNYYDLQSFAYYTSGIHLESKIGELIS